jgi:hypothetical protein
LKTVAAVAAELAGRLKIFDVPDVDVIGFKAGNADVIVAVFGAVLLKVVAGVGCENIFVVATG